MACKSFMPFGRFTCNVIMSPYGSTVTRSTNFQDLNLAILLFGLDAEFRPVAVLLPTTPSPRAWSLKTALC